jgi:hypothetical protein
MRLGGGRSKGWNQVQNDHSALEQEVRRLRSELDRERERRVAAEALASEREKALADAAEALVTKARKRSLRSSRSKLQGNWLR